jgi:predicted dehydrogenase
MPPVASPVRIAVAGAGFIGRRHIEFLQQNASRLELVGAADPVPAAAEWLAARNVRHFADYRQMLNALKPEGVVVATPNQLHEEVAVACLERGIPALVEKPVAHTRESARRICAAVRRTGVPVLVGHHRRHNPMMKAAVEFIASGALGRIVAVAAVDLRRKPDAYYNQAWRRTAGGGPLLINGIHDIDCLRALCGEIDTVMAMTASHARGFEVEDTAAVTFTFANGALGNLTLSDAVQGPWAWEITSGEEGEYPHVHEDCYLITGTEGSLALPTLTHWRNERGGGRADPFLRKQLFYVPADPWVQELLHFGAVARREVEPLLDAENGTRTLAALLAVSRSAEAKRPVTVAELFD